MKRLFCLLLATLSFIICFAQQKVTKVTLKSGTSITGVVTELNPTSHIMIQVAGISTRIEMDDIASIEEVVSQGADIQSAESKNQDPVITDLSDYPESYLLSVGPYNVELVLVRGVIFDMGYDGRGSLKKFSEPVHKVQLSSFYINKAALSEDLVCYLKKGVEERSEKDNKYKPSSVKDAQSIAEALSAKTSMNFDLITEAQCEYVLTSGIINKLLLDKIEYIYCRDYFDDYSISAEPQLDPVVKSKGPKSKRVIRNFTATGTDVYNRYTYLAPNSIRISIKAEELIKRQ